MLQSLLTTLFLVGGVSADIILVDQIGGEGRWEDLYGEEYDTYDNLLDALYYANDGDQIWVAKGTYKPGDDDEDVFFINALDVNLYGGFIGTENPATFDLDERDLIANKTILSGFISGDACDIIVWCHGYSTVIINGFSIDYGDTCVYVDYWSNVEISNCTISNGENYGIYSNLSTVKIYNNMIYQNTNYGIYIYDADGYDEIRNNTLVDNSYGIGYYGFYGGETEYLKVQNCILWDNVDHMTYVINDKYDVSYCCIESEQVWPGTGNINDDPEFHYLTGDDDYHLTIGESPCIDAGNNNAAVGELDIDGEDRIMDGDDDQDADVDMGADEVGDAPYCWYYPTQCHGDADGNGFVDTTDFSIFLGSFVKNYWDDWKEGEGPYNPCADFTRNGYVDTTDFSEFLTWFTKNPPADCNPGGTWPPEEDNEALARISSSDQLLLNRVREVIMSGAADWVRFAQIEGQVLTIEDMSRLSDIYLMGGY